MGSPEVSAGQRGGAKANIKTPEEQTPQNPPHQVNMLRCRLLLVVALVISLGALLSSGQHWSHGWYPGGKRELNSPPSEISAELTLCESGECSYLRPQRRNVLRNIFLDAVARELQRK